MQRGIFLVLEGADGSGKTTQFNLLSERLQAVGYEVEVFDFPRYQEPSSHFIQSYLNGEYGPASEISPYTASLFYALDRYETKSSIAKALDDGKIVLSNRFVGSNMAHQGSKFTNVAERRGFFIWEDSLEFQLLGIPRPDLNLFLHVPAEISYNLISKKGARSYTDKKHDEHEGDINHLRQTVETYEQLCKLFPKDFKLVECTQNNKILSVPQINNLIWDAIKPILPKPQNKPRSRIINLNVPTTDRRPDSAQKIAISITAKREDQLKINIKDVSILESRRVLKYLMAGGEIKLPKRATPQPLFVPKGLTAKLSQAYRQNLNKILISYQRIARQTGVETAQAVLPLAYLVNINALGNSSDWLKFKLDLDEYPSPETKKICLPINRQLSKRWPDIFKKLDIPSAAKIRLTTEVLDKVSAQTGDLKSVSLVSSAPRNELDILTNVIYNNSDLSRDEITASLDKQSYQQKTETLLTYLRVNSVEREDLLATVVYDFDLVTSGVTLSSLLGLGIFKDVQVQPATPRFGYDVSENVDKAGLGDIYMDCFDSSLDLYSQMQVSGHDHDAQYAVLLGNRVRWHGTLNARGFLKLKKIAEGKAAEYSTIIKVMNEQILEVHPIVGSVLTLATKPGTRSKRGK